MRYDRRKLKQDIKEGNRVIKEIKGCRSEPLQPRFGSQEAKTLNRCKATATVLHACAAHLRGKIHLTNWRPPKKGGDVGFRPARRPMTMEEQFDMIKATLEIYAIQESPAEAAVA